MDVPRDKFLVAGDAWRLCRAALTAAYAGDARLHVPDTVYNAVLNRTEPVLP
jgi:hypothetical protein